MASAAGGGGYPLWIAARDTEVRLWAYESSSATGWRQTTGANLTTGTWFHIAATAIKSGATKVYVNGIEKLSFTNDGEVNWTNIFTIGDLRPNRLIAFDGLIDDVRIYNYARTAEQIYNDYKNTHGTLVGDTKFVDGKIGKALEFDGSGDVVMGDFPMAFTDEITMEAWFKVAGTGTGSPRIVELSSVSTSSATHCLAYDTDGTVRAWLDAAGSDDRITTLDDDPTTYNDGAWHHMALTFDDPNAILYMDGVPKDTSSTACSDLDDSVYILIGSIHPGYGGSHAFDGKIDDVRIYNYARTAAQVLDDYNAGAPARLGAQTAGEADPWAGAMPVAHWKLDENTGVLARDASENNNNGTLGGDGAGTDVPTWAHGKHGPGLSFDGGDYVDVGTNVWSNSDVTSGTMEAWVNLSSTSGQQRFVTIEGFVRLCYSEDFANKFQAVVNDGDDVNLDSGITATADTWYHLAVTWNGTTIKLYVDGVQKDSDSQGSPIPDSLTRNVYIGCSWNTDSFTTGLIDDVKIYNYARTQAQVAWDYNRGKPVGHWRMDESTSAAADGDTIYDDSDNNNDGTASSTTWTYTTGKFGGCLDFGGNDYVNGGDDASLKITGEVTISAWVYQDTTGNNIKIVSKRTGNDFYFLGSDSGKLYAGIGDGTTNKVTNKTTTLPSGSWHHCAMTYKDSSDEIKLYLDGLNTETVTCTYVLRSFVANLSIGADSAGTGFYFDGKIDDVRIYNYERTAEQIMQDYNAGAAARLSD